MMRVISGWRGDWGRNWSLLMRRLAASQRPNDRSLVHCRPSQGAQGRHLVAGGRPWRGNRRRFDDPFYASKPDLHPDGDRWHTIGRVGPVLLLMIHTWPEAESEDDEHVGRIISARKATAHERK